MERNMLEKYGIYDVTGGHGSQSYLVVGEERTAVIDTGMAYSAHQLAENVKKILGSRSLDYILLTHSHYDHISGIPMLRKYWPQVQVYAAERTRHVFQSAGARKLICKLNHDAGRLYHCEEKSDMDAEMLWVDHVVAEGDEIAMGDRVFKVYETPGHTRCSVSYQLDDLVLFANESIGVVGPTWTYHPNYLVSYKDSVDSVKKCSALNTQYVAIPHSFIWEREEKPDLWDFCMQSLEESRNFILQLHREGKTSEEILEAFTGCYRDEMGAKEQPLEAFLINAEHMIGAVLREFQEG